VSKQSEGTTLYLRGMPRQVVREAKAAAARRGSTLARFASEAFEHALGVGSGAALEPSEDGDLARSMAWFERNRSRLLARYPEEFIAILEDRVLDHDADFDALARRIFEQVGRQTVYMPHLGRAKAVARVRSPRLVRK
jgi:hypothetical protein